ncbi:hypothetical protein HanHA89_Chr01g0010741 [Helianthus annuus]|nr:hypothetical protein HanHA89_Chr01g0010741 [Helianthus annuus]
MKLVSNNEETLRVLYRNLSEDTMVQDLRNYYEANSTNEFENKVFIKMMLLDACFILYYLLFIFGQPENRQQLKNNYDAFVYQDLFLLENQIPFVVLTKVMNLLHIDCNKIKPFIYDNILATQRPKTWWFRSMFCTRNHPVYQEQLREMIDVEQPDHLLDLLHRSLTEKRLPEVNDWSQSNKCRCTFRNVTELKNLGIHFKPSSTMSLTHIEFRKSKWWFSADVNLPPITVNDSTKPMLLNLIAYETCSSRDDAAYDAWVTSYVCLLDTLIDHPEDVTSLRKAGVLENCLGSDEEVATLFNQIGTDLVPNHLAYLEAKNSIQMHYENPRNIYFSQLKHEYFKSPWSSLALVGALLVIALNGVQTFFTIWPSKDECDSLCAMLKKNHHH